MGDNTHFDCILVNFFKCLFIKAVSIADNRRGACWSVINRGGGCEKEVSMSITKDECCGTIGKAWGSPCEPCPLVEGIVKHYSSNILLGRVFKANYVK